MSLAHTGLLRIARASATSTFPWPASCSLRGLSTGLPRLGQARERALPASFYRGGTSKGIVVRSEDLPTDVAQRDAMFLSAMGSPDPNGRQLDGMGGGLSSLSKVIIVGKSAREDVDVDYTFAQIHVKAAVVDYASNCGNMLAAVGPFALEHNLVTPKIQDGQAVVRILNTNTNKVVHSRFPVHSDAPNQPDLTGDFSIDGVSGTHARITLDFVDPAGSRTGNLFPTGALVETLALPDGEIQATLMDCGNPCVYILAANLGVEGTVLPGDLEADAAIISKLDNIRAAAALKMGLTKSLDEGLTTMKSVPKVCIMSPPVDHTVVSGATIKADQVDVVTRCISAGDPHRALPITASLCTAAAALVPGTLVNACLGSSRATADGVVIGHASGTIHVGADVVQEGEGWTVPRARVFRTARKLMEGNVFYKG